MTTSTSIEQGLSDLVQRTTELFTNRVVTLFVGSELAKHPVTEGSPIRVTRTLVPRATHSFETASDEPFDVASQDFMFLQSNKVLRLCQTGLRSSSRPNRINGDIPIGRPLATKGEAMIHGPHLVARPVGSEWRTRRPYERYIQTNSKRETENHEIAFS